MGDLIIKPESGGSIKLQNNAGTNALVSDNSGNIALGGTLGVTGNTTLSGSANNLGTVTAGTISTGATIATGVHGKYVLENYDNFYYATATTSTTTSQDAINICGTNYVTMATGTSTSDLLTFEMNFGGLHRNTHTTYMGLGFERATATDFGTNQAVPWRTGQHTWGGYNGAPDTYEGYYSATKTRSVADWGLSASTTYYFRLIGQTHSVAGSYKWGASSTNSSNSTGVKMSCFKWRLL